MTEGPRASPRPALVVVVAGGDRIDPSCATDLSPGATVVAADSGVDRALEIGLAVHHAIGDFDSVTPGGLAHIEHQGATLHRHPSAKNATDLELALDLACSWCPQRVIVLGGNGGRLDHFAANVTLLASTIYAHVAMEARMGTARVTIVRPGADRRAELHGQPNELVSLLAMHGAASGVRTEGLLYRLDDEVLYAGSSRGVSNRLLSTSASVGLAAGVLVAIQPGTEEEP